MQTNKMADWLGWVANMKLTKNQMIIGGLAVGAAAVYLIGVKGIAFGAGKAVVDAVGGAATGAVYGASDFVGLENPDATKCAKAKAAGDSWGASFSCPAGDFLKYFFK